MVKINLKNKVIPIDFGEFQLEFSKSDENLKKMREFGKDLEEKGQEIVKEDGKEDMDKVRELLHLAYDGVFGEGSFDKVYELSGHSTIDTLNYFFEVLSGIEEEQVSEESKKLMERYIGKKP